MGRKFVKTAYIDEERCIGCARCLEVCPVDAIVGARGFTHTVLAEECVGCRLCLKPCPVDCIEMVPMPELLQPKTPEALRARAERARFRSRLRKRRLKEAEEAHRRRLELKKRALLERLGERAGRGS